MKHKRVLIFEEDEHEGREQWWTGRFTGAVENGEEITDVSFEEALTWARSVAEVVEIDYEDLDRFVDGPDPVDGMPPLSPERAERLRRGRRRPEGEEWRDRGEDEPPIPWQVVMELEPYELEITDEMRATVEHVVAALVAAGCQDLSWTDESLRRRIAEIERQWKAAGEPEVFGWSTSGPGAFEIAAIAHASSPSALRTSLLAAASALSADEWDVEVDVRPADDGD